MLLRVSNNPNIDLRILNVLKQLLPANTQLAASSESGTGLEQIYIQNKYIMSQGSFPAVHLSSGTQNYKKNSLRTYFGAMQAIIEYYDRWDEQPITIDAIRANIALDLERMKANIETNDSLSFGGAANAISIPDMTLSAYKGEFDTQFPGLTLVYRTLTLMINILPYDC
jgi:hypothetical protein